jgi:MoxR-like ATPase
MSAADFSRVKGLIDSCRTEAAKRIIGQKEVIDGILLALIAGGHALLEGPPGLAKTLAAKTIADITGLDFKRIQFTPDLLPADITGTLIYERGAGTFSVRKGPVFTNFVLADEINRAGAKVQSALLEAMAEKQVTIGETTNKLPDPFFVLATENPIEQEGTYALPEAELDRFLLKLVISYPSRGEEKLIAQTGGNSGSIPVKEVFPAASIFECRALAEKIVCDEKIVDYIVSLVAVTRPPSHTGEKKSGMVSSASFSHIPSVKKDDMLKYIAFGASPRASIALLSCAKVYALFEGRNYVLPEDVKKAALPVLRHRLLLSYEAQADDVTTDDIITKILSVLPVP